MAVPPSSLKKLSKVNTSSEELIILSKFGILFTIKGLLSKTLRKSQVPCNSTPVALDVPISPTAKSVEACCKAVNKLPAAVIVPKVVRGATPTSVYSQTTSPFAGLTTK